MTRGRPALPEVGDLPGNDWFGTPRRVMDTGCRMRSFRGPPGPRPASRPARFANDEGIHGRSGGDASHVLVSTQPLAGAIMGSSPHFHRAHFDHVRRAADRPARRDCPPGDPPVHRNLAVSQAVWHSKFLAGLSVVGWTLPGDPATSACDRNSAEPGRCGPQTVQFESDTDTGCAGLMQQVMCIRASTWPCAIVVQIGADDFHVLPTTRPRARFVVGSATRPATCIRSVSRSAAGCVRIWPAACSGDSATH
jgi:hypothetical protein